MYEIIEQEKMLNDAKIKLSEMNFEENKFASNNDRLNVLNLDLEKCFNKKQELLSLKNSILLAKDGLEIAYNKAKENISPHLQHNLSKFCNTVLNNDYKNRRQNKNDYRCSDGFHKYALLIITI